MQNHYRHYLKDWNKVFWKNIVFVNSSTKLTRWRIDDLEEAFWITNGHEIWNSGFLKHKSNIGFEMKTYNDNDDNAYVGGAPVKHFETFYWRNSLNPN